MFNYYYLQQSFIIVKQNKNGMLPKALKTTTFKYSHSNPYSLFKNLFKKNWCKEKR